MSSEEKAHSRVGLLQRARTVAAALLAVVSTLALIGDKLDSVGSSPIMAHAYVVGHVFRAEAVLLLILIVAFPWFARIVRDLRSGVPWVRGNWPRLSVREKLSVTASGAIVLACASVIAYHGYFYLIGKRLLLSRYPTWAIARANAAFGENDLKAARWSLRACADVVKDAECKNLMEMLDRRVRLAAEIRGLARGQARIGPQFANVLRDGYALDRDAAAYDALAASWKKERDDLQGVFRRGLEAAAGGRTADALSLLREVNQRTPGFGNAHRIIEDILQQDRGGSAGVHLAALRRYGVDAFITQIVQVREIPAAGELDSWSLYWE